MSGAMSDRTDFNHSPVPEVTYEHRPVELFQSRYKPTKHPARVALILNSPIASIGLFHAVWQNCHLKICADGGANRLWDLFGEDEGARLKYAPDRIHGDLDSLRPDVHEYYATKTDCTITKDDDKYSTDYGKCLGIIRESFESSPSLEVVILGSLGGRVDQGIGLLGEIMREMMTMTARDEGSRGQMMKQWLVSEESLTFLLLPGKNVIMLPPGSVAGQSQEGRGGSIGPLFTPNVGILPLFGKAHISTQGLEWDVVDWPTEMGGQVSTSNHIMADEVTVWTEKEVFFTVELNNKDFDNASEKQ